MTPTPPARAWTHLLGKYGEPWALYTSNSYRRIGTAIGYEELVYAAKHSDGCLSIEARSHEHLERIVACVNALAGVEDPTAVRRLVSAARAYMRLKNRDTAAAFRAALAEFPEE